MTELTDAQAEKARKDLEAYNARKAAEARTAENEKRAASRAALDPVVALLPEAAALQEKLADLGDAGIEGERGVVDLIRNVVIVLDSLATRVQRRIDDTEPVPEPPAEPVPA